MNTLGIMEDIRSLLNEGRTSAEVISMGHAPSSVYKAQRQVRKATDRTEQPMTQVLVTNMASEGWTELREENTANSVARSMETAKEAPYLSNP